MAMNRREFVKVGAMAGAAMMLARKAAWAAFFQSPGLQKFVWPLRRFGADIPLATPVTPSGGAGLPDFYQIAMREFTDKLHRDLPPTPLRGYGNYLASDDGLEQPANFKHLGGAIIAKVGTPARVSWHNRLHAGQPFSLGKTGIPVDTSVITPYGISEGAGHDRAAPHLHGGLVPWTSDGGPFHWFSSQDVRGPSVDPLGWLGGTNDYWYPNTQTPRFMWYHDHAVGITRLNAYAGLATGYLLVSDDESVLLRRMGVHPASEIPLVIQDKVFRTDGGLWYPNEYDVQFFALAKNPKIPVLPVPSLVPEFWGDTILVNGTISPYVDIEPRRYRLRILNACNTRFMSLRLVAAMGRTAPLNTEGDVAKPGPVMTVIGTEGGFLDGSTPAVAKGVAYNNTVAMPLVVAPGERVDIVIDFSKVKTVAGKDPLCFILYNDAPVPFPGGTPLADFWTGNRKLAVPPAPGFGPDTRNLLQFRIYPLGTLNPEGDPSVDTTWKLPDSPAPTPTAGRNVVDLALYETIDDYGRLAQNLGPLAGPMGLMEPPTEVVKAGTVEVWRIFNVTADTHPIHFHFVNVRVLSRQAFSWRGGLPNFVSAAVPPEPHEQGWKETVRMNPGECTTLLVEVPSLTGLAPAGANLAPQRPGISGHEYVWHCHILEHEEHDMMRPLIVEP